MRAIIPGVHFPKLDAGWLSAPAESSTDFLPAFRAISVAVQVTLRERVPEAYFADSKNFQDLQRAYPMLVYQASRPFRTKSKTDLTYDVLNPRMMRGLLRRVRASLVELLAPVEARLRQAGLVELAGQYTPKRAGEIVQSVQRLANSRRCLYGVIRAEGVLVDGLTQLGGLARFPPREQAIRLSAFARKWNYQLRRLYPRTNFTWLTEVLLDAATQTLLCFQDGLAGTGSSVNAAGAGGIDPDPGAV